MGAAFPVAASRWTHALRLLAFRSPVVASLHLAGRLYLLPRSHAGLCGLAFGCIPSPLAMVVVGAVLGCFPALLAWLCSGLPVRLVASCCFSCRVSAWSGCAAGCYGAAWTSLGTCSGYSCHRLGGICRRFWRGHAACLLAASLYLLSQRKHWPTALAGLGCAALLIFLRPVSIWKQAAKNNMWD